MKKRLAAVLTATILCLTLGACGSREIDWGPDTPEVLPSTDEVVTYVTPERPEVYDLSLISCSTASVTNGNMIKVMVNGQYRDITLYGIAVPDKYEDEVKDYLNASLPETVYLDYIDEEAGSAYVWVTNDVSMISGCVNYQMCYKGYAVVNPAQEPEDVSLYEKAEEWAADTASGLWVYENIRDISISENSVSINSISENGVSENSVSGNTSPGTINSEPIQSEEG